MASTEQHDELMAEIERRAREQEERLLYERYLSERRTSMFRRTLFLAVLVTTFAGVALNYFFEASSPFQSQIQRVLGLLLPLVALSAAALSYLQPSTARRSVTDAEENFARTRFYLDKRLEELKATLGTATPTARRSPKPTVHEC